MDREKPIDFQDISLLKWLPGGHIGFFGARTPTLVCVCVSSLNLCVCKQSFWFSAMSLSKWLPGGDIEFFCSWSLTLVWLWISSPNFRITWSLRPMGFQWSPFRNGCLTAIVDISVFGLQFGLDFQIQASVAQYLCVWVDRSLVILNNVQLQSKHCPLLSHSAGRGYPSRSLVNNLSFIFCEGCDALVIISHSSD